MEANRYAEREYKNLRHKYLVSKFSFIFLNVCSILLVSVLILLNIFAIRWNNNPHYQDTKMWFVVIASLNGSVGFFTTLLSFLKVKNKLKKLAIALVAMNKEKDEYHKKIGIYEKATKRDERFIRSVLNILDTVN